jgi:hypothetical protein
MARAMEYACKLLVEESPAPANVQSSYLREFLHILEVRVLQRTDGTCIHVTELRTVNHCRKPPNPVK